MKSNRKAKFAENEKADARMVGILVAVLVIITIGMLVFYEISNSIKITSTAGKTAHSNVNNTAVTVFTLAPIVAIVLVASIILGVVTSFGAKPGGGI